MIDLSFKYKQTITHLKKESPFTPDVTIILGSGLGIFADSIKKIKSFGTSGIPAYPKSTVEGHDGLIHFAKFESKKLMVFQGRLHFYEGYPLSDCLLPVLLTHRLGCNQIIFTNASGGVNRNLVPGDLMLIDSFNAIYLKKEITSVIGIASIEKRNNFLNCPSKRINYVIRQSAKKNNISLKSGTYWYTKGPNYETPAEVTMISKSGGDAVGMSTVHEAVFASSLGMEVGVISCITNMAAGISKQKLSHTEVTDTANKVAKNFSLLLKSTISRL